MLYERVTWLLALFFCVVSVPTYASVSPLNAANLTYFPKDVVYRMRATFDTEPLGEFNSKGKEERVEFQNAIYFAGSDRGFVIANSQLPAQVGSNSSEGENRFLRTDFPQGCYGHDRCGVQILSRFDYEKDNRTTDEDLWMTYAWRIGEDFDFAKGGILPGFCGGGGNKCMTRCGTPVSPGTGWSVRMSWNKNGELQAHLFHLDKTTNCGEDVRMRFTDTQEIPVLRRGQWQTVEFHLVLNNQGQRDAILEVFVDQRRCLYLENLAFRGNDPRGAIDKVYLSMFHGGNSEDFAPSVYSYIDYDAFLMTDRKLLREIVLPPIPFSVPIEVYVSAGVGFGVFATVLFVSRRNRNRVPPLGSGDSGLFKSSGSGFGVVAPPAGMGSNASLPKFASSASVFDIQVGQQPQQQYVQPPQQQPPQVQQQVSQPPQIQQQQVPQPPQIQQQAPYQLQAQQPQQSQLQQAPTAQDQQTKPNLASPVIPTAFTVATAAASRAFTPQLPSALQQLERQKQMQQDTQGVRSQYIVDSYAANILGVPKTGSPTASSPVSTRTVDSYTANMLSKKVGSRLRTGSEAQVQSRLASRRSRAASRMRAKTETNLD